MELVEQPIRAAIGALRAAGVAAGNFGNLVGLYFELFQVDHAGLLCVHNNTSKYVSDRYRAKGDLAAHTDLHPRRTAATTGQSYSDSGKKSSAYARQEWITLYQTGMDHRMLFHPTRLCSFPG